MNDSEWDVIEGGGDGVSAYVNNRAMEAINILYTRYVNEVIMLDM